MASADIEVWYAGPWRKVLADALPSEGSGRFAVGACVNERRSLQVALHAPAALDGVTVAVEGALADAGVWRLYQVGAVPTRDHGRVPDPLFPLFSPTHVESGAGAFWLTVHTAAPGTWSGSIVLRAGGEELGRVEGELTVSPVALPDPQGFRFYLDLWQQPSAVADELGIERWSDAHWHALAPYLTELASLGQKPITTTLIDEPWGHQTERDFPSLVDWIPEGEGWRWGYERFDRYVELAMACGLPGPITAYSLVLGPGERRDCVFTGVDGKQVTCAIGDAVYRRTWTAFLRDFVAHLETRGWLARTQIGFDEKPGEVMREAIGLVREAAPELQVALAGNYMAEYDAGIDDYSVIYPGPSREACVARRERGVRTTVYTCCGPARPNTFVTSPPIEATLLGWLAAHLRADGYLRWAYTSWPRDALADPAFGTWPVGDTFLVYRGPTGPIPTQRWEMLREGIQDYELIERAREAGGDAAVDPLVAATQREHDGHEADGAVIEDAREQLRRIAEQAG